ncbi:hypothetical protein Goarm_012155 [Gossypium armourianum]|uniref:Uncharacterized protein n=1 Tax=Gossypium armourianum TaxID=34283 RepID=A0A7J9IYZ8_9ROSI|nr:hypothetical protein [Gossypium armourianum]
MAIINSLSIPTYIPLKTQSFFSPRSKAFSVLNKPRKVPFSVQSMGSSASSQRPENNNAVQGKKQCSSVIRLRLNSKLSPVYIKDF